ncbi:MAG TPA: TonB-dependent receptor [Chitinophagaceae bacterium]|nr:TonB-dependent receptor [Chitinophagaceae bacterium]
MRANLLRSKATLYALMFLLVMLKISDVNAQERSGLLKGLVKNNNGDPLAGVSVILKHTKTNFTRGTTTDNSGTFTFSRIPPGGPYTFTMSAVGFEDQVLSNYNIEGDAPLSLDVMMKEASATLDQVVVVGYGTQKRRDLTGAVGSVGSKEIKDLAVTRIDQALLGKVAGVQVKPSTGEPGAAPQIRVRGIGSISAGGTPLYVVDGFPTDNIQSLNPNDIETMDVLKDASATAIYGSRGSNGVIIINTKRGKSGKTNINFDTYYGWQQASRVPEFMTAREQAQYYYDGIVNRNLDNNNPVTGNPASWRIPVPGDVLDVLSGKITTETDALDAVLRTAPQQQYQLTVSGGSEKVRYALSGEYLNQEGIVLNTGFNRYSVRANIDAQLTKKLAIKLNLNPSYTTANIVLSTGGSGGQNEGVIAQATNVQPFYPIYNPDGTYFVFSPGMSAGPTAYNPVALAKEITNKQQRMRVIGNISAEYSIFKDLKFNVMIGGSLLSQQAMRFRPNLPVFLNIPAEGLDNSSIGYNWLTEYTLNYNKNIGKHSISGVGGYTVQKERFNSNFLISNNYPNNLVPTLSATSGIITNGSSDIYQWSLISYLARANYNYNNKYYLTASIRTDGSSRFGSENKYGIFPSAAVAWRVSEEKFLKDVSFLNELKIRASYGETGNNNIGNYEHFSIINYVKYVGAGGAVAGYVPARPANPGLTWEKQQSFNLGLNASVANERVSFTVDYFKSRNTDLLLNVNVPAITGFNTALQNIGEVENSGWEFSVNTVNVKSRKFEWSTNFNISTYKNKVVKLGPNGDPIFVEGSVTMIGKPIGMFFGWLTDGIFLNQSEVDKGPIFAPGSINRSRPGDMRFKDVSGPDGKPDGIIDNNDRTIMGSPYPDFYYGMTNNFSFQNFSLNISFQGSQGNSALNIARSGALSTRGRIRTLAFLKNYWKSEQDPGDGKTPRPNDQPTGNVRGLYSQRYLGDASYLRINNISLSYLLPGKISEKMRLGSARIYITSTNPFLFTKYTNFNPDVSTTENALTPGVDNNDYPLPKSLLIGLNIGF